MGSNGIEFVCVHEERYKREKTGRFLTPQKQGFFSDNFFLIWSIFALAQWFFLGPKSNSNYTIRDKKSEIIAL